MIIAQILPGLIWSQLALVASLSRFGPRRGLILSSLALHQRDSASIYFRDILLECTLLCCIFDALQPHLTECVKHTLNGNLKTPRPIFISGILVGICDISTHFRIQSKPQLQGEQKWHALYGKSNCPWFAICMHLLPPQQDQ